tara:strand:+ start:558 stop:1355 length:798 start_codon:yes stop_codon:yes gene_type:complete
MKKILCAIVSMLAVSVGLKAFEFNRQPAGLIKGARLSYVSSTTVKIGVGYGESMGSYWEIAATDTLATNGYTLTGLTTTANGVVQYIYIDRSSSSLPDVAITNSTTAPTWSDDFLGWYRGTDRCIGAVWISASGAILEFKCPDDETYLLNNGLIPIPQILPNSYGVYSSLDISPYSPANASHMYTSVAAWATSLNWFSVRVAIRTDPTDTFTADGVQRADISHWLSYLRNETKNLDWMAFAETAPGVLTTTGGITVRIQGYRLER